MNACTLMFVCCVFELFLCRAVFPPLTCQWSRVAWNLNSSFVPARYFVGFKPACQMKRVLHFHVLPGRTRKNIIVRPLSRAAWTNSKKHNCSCVVLVHSPILCKKE